MEEIIFYARLYSKFDECITTELSPPMSEATPQKNNLARSVRNQMHKCIRKSSSIFSNRSGSNGENTESTRKQSLKGELESMEEALGKISRIWHSFTRNEDALAGDDETTTTSGDYPFNKTSSIANISPNRTNSGNDLASSSARVHSIAANFVPESDLMSISRIWERFATLMEPNLFEENARRGSSRDAMQPATEEEDRNWTEWLSRTNSRVEELVMSRAVTATKRHCAIIANSQGQISDLPPTSSPPENIPRSRFDSSSTNTSSTPSQSRFSTSTLSSQNSNWSEADILPLSSQDDEEPGIVEEHIGCFVPRQGRASSIHFETVDWQAPPRESFQHDDDVPAGYFDPCIVAEPAPPYEKCPTSIVMLTSGRGPQLYYDTWI